MANISPYLAKILSAVYGEEVRGSIHDALAAMNTESSNAMQYASTAKDSAQAAAASAQSSASTAVQKANEASSSAGAAKAAEINAQAAEASSRSSAAAALSAKTAAEAAKEDAKVSAASALNAKTDTDSAKKAAEAARLAAETARDNASDSADAAAASALSAQQYSGKPPQPKDGTWWIWDAAAQMYIDSKISCELEGPRGASITDIRLTSGDHTPGTTDIYTVILSDGDTYPISVYNGRNGMGAGDVLGIWFDLVIPAEGWADGKVIVADERLLALSTHKYFLSVSEASRDESLACNVQPKDIITSGFITFTSDTVPTKDLTVNLTRFELSANGAD